MPDEYEPFKNGIRRAAPDGIEADSILYLNHEILEIRRVFASRLWTYFNSRQIVGEGFLNVQLQKQVHL